MKGGIKLDIIKEGKKVFDIEMSGIENMKKNLGNSFVKLVEKINDCKGRVILTGIGKSGHICRKIAATMQSIGITAYFMHPGEGLHGDLGAITKKDLVIAVGRSGESEEVLKLIPSIQKIGADLTCIVERKNSTITKFASTVVVMPQTEEAYMENLAPTTSSTVTLVLGDAIAVVASKLRNFTPQDYALFHPNGRIGKRLTLKVKDLMLKGKENAIIKSKTTVKQAVLEMCNKPISGVNIVNDDKELIGIFTDGDLRRLINEKGINALEYTIDDVMTKKPVTTDSELLIVDVLSKMEKNGKMITMVPVLEGKKLVGSLRLMDIIESGVI